MATYPKIQKLGAGAFGEVWKVERDPPNGVWIYAAMKIIKVVEELAIFIILIHSCALWNYLFGG